MAHFAKVVIDPNYKKPVVVDIIVADQDFIKNIKDNRPGEWIQTSYNTYGGIHYKRNEDGSLGEPSEDQSKALRYNYAIIGGLYDKNADAFHRIQPYNSWTLNTDTYLWEPPIPCPNDGLYVWSEERYQLDNEEGWVPLGDDSGCCPGT